jgi:CheY-like chemotaxis protein
MSDAAGDLRSVVRTMKALAASNIGQYERSVCALADCNKESGEYRCHTHQYRCQIGVSTNLPIIAQTANSFSEDREKCFAAGMVGYIAKPIDPEALANLVLQQVIARRNG